MSIDFQDATPVNAPAGRKAEPNPFHDVINDIANRSFNEGQPVAKSFEFDHETVDNEKDREKFVAKYRRQLADAGNRLVNPVTVRVHFEPVKKGPKGRETDSATRTKVTFWTVEKQFRPRKSSKSQNTSTDQPINTQTASTDQSISVTDPA